MKNGKVEETAHVYTASKEERPRIHSPSCLAPGFTYLTTSLSCVSHNGQFLRRTNFIRATNDLLVPQVKCFLTIH